LFQTIIFPSGLHSFFEPPNKEYYNFYLFGSTIGDIGFFTNFVLHFHEHKINPYLKTYLI